MCHAHCRAAVLRTADQCSWRPAQGTLCLLIQTMHYPHVPIVLSYHSAGKTRGSFRAPLFLCHGSGCQHRSLHKVSPPQIGSDAPLTTSPQLLVQIVVQDASTGVRRAHALRKKMNTVDVYCEARELPDTLRQEMYSYYQDVWVSYDGQSTCPSQSHSLTKDACWIAHRPSGCRKRTPLKPRCAREPAPW